MPPSDHEQPPNGLSFGKFLRLCIKLGLRPKDDPQQGEPWDKQKLAAEIGIGDRQFDNWLADTSLPKRTTAIERSLFGKDQNYRKEWRLKLRDALERTRDAIETAEAGTDVPERPVQDVSPGHTDRTWRNILALLAGGSLVAVGLIHLAWLATTIPQEGMLELVKDPWTYSDLVFGVGGVVIGPPTMRTRHWARLGGISLCVLGVITSILWFVDLNTSVTDVMYAMNVITTTLSVVGLLFFLFGWPHDLRSRKS